VTKQPTRSELPRLEGTIHVGLVDDHPAIVASIAAAIDASEDLRVAGVASTLDEALALVAPDRDPPIDVLLCDMQLAGGAEGLRLLNARDATQGRRPAIVILSGFDQPSLIRAAFERGAAGYLVKTAPLDTILEAIRTVAAGGTAFSASAVGAVRSAQRRPSDREIQVLGLVRAGGSNAEVAASLGVSEKTVESHLRRMFDRYGVLSRTELTVFAINEGWVTASGTAP
jgi:DNA-binding NarL/FixJ family response regulator